MKLIVKIIDKHSKKIILITKLIVFYYIIMLVWTLFLLFSQVAFSPLADFPCPVSPMEGFIINERQNIELDTTIFLELTTYEPSSLGAGCLVKVSKGEPLVLGTPPEVTIKRIGNNLNINTENIAKGEMYYTWVAYPTINPWLVPISYYRIQNKGIVNCFKGNCNYDIIYASGEIGKQKTLNLLGITGFIIFTALLYYSRKKWGKNDE